MLSVLKLLLAVVAAPVAATPWNPVQESRLLSVDEAFTFAPVVWRGGYLEVPFRIEPGHYLYRHGMAIRGVADAQAFPKGLPHEDEFFGTVEIYRQDLVVRLPMKHPRPTITIQYQGCADVGICYPPQTRTLAVEVLP